MNRRCRSMRRVVPALAIALSLAAALGCGGRPSHDWGFVLTLGGRVPLTVAIGARAVDRLDAAGATRRPAM